MLARVSTTHPQSIPHIPAPREQTTTGIPSLNLLPSNKLKRNGTSRRTQTQMCGAEDTTVAHSWAAVTWLTAITASHCQLSCLCSEHLQDGR